MTSSTWCEVHNWGFKQLSYSWLTQRLMWRKLPSQVPLGSSSLSGFLTSQWWDLKLCRRAVKYLKLKEVLYILENNCPKRILHQILGKKSNGVLDMITLYRIYDTNILLKKEMKALKKTKRRSVVFPPLPPYSFKGESWHNFWQLLDNGWWGLCRRLWRWNMGRNEGNMKLLCLFWFFITLF